MNKVELKTGLDFIMLPRPVVLATCMDDAGKVDILTLGWAMPASHQPLVVAIAVSPKRYSHDLIAKSGEFVVNIPDETMGEVANWCGRKSGRRYDKFEHTGLHTEPSKYIKTPRIAECYAALECKVIASTVAGDHTTFFGEVVGAFVNEGTFSDVEAGGPPKQYFDPKQIKTLQHLGGNMYVTNTEEWKDYPVGGQIDV